MENIKKSEKSFKAATICLVISVILSVISMATAESQLRGQYNSDVVGKALLIGFIILALVTWLEFFILSKIKQGSINAWIWLLVLSVLGIVFSLANASEQFNFLSLVGIVLTVLLLVFSKQGLNALEQERNEMWKNKNNQGAQYEKQNLNNFQKEEATTKLKEELKQELKEELQAELKKEIQEDSNN